MGLTVSRVPVDPVGPCRCSGCQCFCQPVGHRCAGEALVPPLPVAVATQHAVRPAAGGFWDPGGLTRRTRIGVGQVAHPATADRGAMPTGWYVKRIFGVDGPDIHARRDQRRRAEPVAGQCRRRRQFQPVRGVADGAQHLGSAAEITEPVDSHAPSFAEISAAADFAYGRRRRELVGIAHRVWGRRLLVASVPAWWQPMCRSGWIHLFLICSLTIKVELPASSSRKMATSCWYRPRGAWSWVPAALSTIWRCVPNSRQRRSAPIGRSQPKKTPGMGSVPARKPVPRSPWWRMPGGGRRSRYPGNRIFV